jgi:hypothetical protein
MPACFFFMRCFRWDSEMPSLRKIWENELANKRDQEEAARAKQHAEEEARIKARRDMQHSVLISQLTNHLGQPRCDGPRYLT